MAQYWDFRFKTEKIKNCKRVTCLIQTTLINRPWKSQRGRRRKSLHKAQRYNKKLNTHHASKVEHFTLCECCALFYFPKKMVLHKFVTLHWKMVVLHWKKSGCTIVHVKLYVHHYCNGRNSTEQGISACGSSLKSWIDYTVWESECSYICLNISTEGVN